MTSADSPLPTRRLRVRRSAAITGAAFVAWLTVAPLSLSLIVEQPLWSPVSVVLGVVLLFVPLGISMWAWRAGVDVTTDGIAVRGMFSTREIPWQQIDGFATGNEGVQAILADQSQVRLDPLRPENLPQVLEIGGQELRTDAPDER
ncbi:PH domain-containing protein [Glycomyces artemisiae]|uniref:PH (Pleckstrin Homology) domain-containing protein n=1 Tax=Glycomyces artemisiae TaxID=1076443 RepID=A0A2T0UKD6_9ACTN|nr:PH domain-containing protein [Glycomyces artemisiae]PRY58346.1 PH (Pleckstrin Homology) domain-containing protein [Glycomyces artemisiae]